MYFYELIKDLSKNEKVRLYIDMDGVIASYDFGKKLDFATKRPLKTNINTLKKVSTLPNIELWILSCCRKTNEIAIKNAWLDEHASFISKERRVILAREDFNNDHASIIKLNYLKNLNIDEKIILVDDDITVLNLINQNLKNITLFQDSELID